MQKFTYPRNAFGDSIDESARNTLDVLVRVEAKTFKRDPSDPSRLKDEQFIDMKNVLAIAQGSYENAAVTDIGNKFRKIAQASQAEAWRWLLTRSLWLYSVPNGSQGHFNGPARELGVHFNFFDMIIRLCVHLSALPAPANTLYFDELLAVLNDDTNWSLSPEAFYDHYISKRVELGIANLADHEVLLGEPNLEGKYGVKRDNMNRIFAQVYAQTGLFSRRQSANKFIGVYLDPGVYSDPIMARRLRFLLDNPRQYCE